jgi:hypothetical protein
MSRLFSFLQETPHNSSDNFFTQVVKENVYKQINMITEYKIKYISEIINETLNEHSGHALVISGGEKMQILLVISTTITLNQSQKLLISNASYVLN